MSTPEEHDLSDGNSLGHRNLPWWVPSATADCQPPGSRATPPAYASQPCRSPPAICRLRPRSVPTLRWHNMAGLQSGRRSEGSPTAAADRYCDCQW